MRRLLLTALAACCLAPSAARAAETATPVPQLAAYNLDWLAYLDPADQPANRMAVCIVDTGIAITPDTPADNPSGPILRRLAVDGGSGEPQGDGFEFLHGTRTAFSAIAPQNDWGTVGVWPGGVAIGVRASQNGQSSFVQSGYKYGISKCLIQTSDFPIGVIEIALSCLSCSASEDDMNALEDSVGIAHNRDVSVVAAAGNQPGESTFPASVPGMFAVTEGDSNGAICAHAATDPVAALVVAPGCPTESADPFSGIPLTLADGGTSAASAEVASLLAFLRSHRPGVNYGQAELWVRESVRTVGGYKILDGEAAARSAGLGAVVERARRRQSAQSTPTVAATPVPATSATQTPAGGANNEQKDPVVSTKRMTAPTGGRISWSRNRLHVKLPKSHPARDVQLIVRYSRVKVRRAVRSARRFTWKLPSRPRSLTLIALPKLEFGARPSRPVVYRLVASGRYAEQ